jgi:hypothetical protein
MIGGNPIPCDEIAIDSGTEKKPTAANTGSAVEGCRAESRALITAGRIEVDTSTRPRSVATRTRRHLVNDDALESNRVIGRRGQALLDYLDAQVERERRRDLGVNRFGRPTRRSLGTNARALGTNPRARGTNPREAKQRGVRWVTQWPNG